MNLSFSAPNALFSYTLTTHPNATNFEKHCHSCYELLYVVNGSGTYIAEGTEYALLPNTLLLLPPLEYHYVQPSSSQPYERYVFNFSTETVPERFLDSPILRKYLSGDEKYHSSDRISEAVQSLFRVVPTILKDPSHDLAESMMSEILGQILYFLSCEETPPAEKPQKKSFSEIIDFLNLHLCDPVTLNDLADRFYISKYHLCHSFRERTGISVIAYLNTKRVALAQQLLDKGVPPTEVCYRVGFSDYSVFYRAFRRQNGYSPSKYKKNE